MITERDLRLARKAAARLLPAAPAKRQQSTNRKLPRNVYPHGERFRAQVCVKGQLITIGVYRTPELAEQAVATWREQQGIAPRMARAKEKKTKE